MTSERVLLRSQDGLSLEAELDAASEPKATLVLCHPHPKMGGTMNAPLLTAVSDHLVSAGFSVLRFNFRGIGGSQGASTTGIAEVADASAAIGFARDRGAGSPVALAGWSFGGAVALHAASEHHDLSACVAISPSVRAKPEISAGAPSPEDYTFPGPTLIICGVNDDQVAPEDCRKWAQATGSAYEEMKGANHFFWAKYEPLAEMITAFLVAAIQA